MSDTVPGPPDGSQFGHYQLRRLLGSGGVGEVYEADDTVKQRVVALKVISPALSQDPEFRERLLRVAHGAAQLRGAHVVRLNDYGEIDGQLYLDMGLVEGTDLATMLKRGGPLNPPRAVGIIAQVARALDGAHAAGVTHRDVKPENILITADDFAYLTDFGVADAVVRDGTTKPEIPPATWKYTAPERFADDELTNRADIYALTCVLYECLTGSPPYPADTIKNVITAHLMQPIPRPSELRPEVPAAFDDVVARGMAKDPRARYVSAGDLARAAHQALSGGVVESTQVAPWPPETYHEQTVVAETRAWSEDPGIVAPAYFPALEEAHRKRKRNLVLGALAAALVVVLAVVAIWLLYPSSPAPTATDTTTSPSATPTSTLPAAEVQDRLTKRLPPGYPTGVCKPVAPPKEAQAKAQCGQNADPNGPPSASYTLYRDAASLKAGFDNLVASSVVFDCPGRIQSPGPWRDRTGKTSGTLLCASQRGNQLVAWTNQDTLLLNVAQSAPQGPTIDQLYLWWSLHS